MKPDAGVTDKPETAEGPKPAGGLGARRLRIEVVPPSALRMSLVRVVAVLIGLVFGLLFILLRSSSQGDVLDTLWSATFGSPRGISSVIELTTPLAIAGVAVAVAARAGLWNIGVEGQLFMGAWAAAAVAFSAPGLPGPLLAVLMLIAGAIGGALWTLLPAFWRARWGVSEIVTTLMLNFVASLWVIYWVLGPWQASQLAGSGSLDSKSFASGTEFPEFTIAGSKVGLGAFLALAIVVVVWAGFRYTRFGYRLDLTGSSERTAVYAGIVMTRAQVAAMLISGALGGLTGVVMELGQVHNFGTTLSANFGYTGIVVAALAGWSIGMVLPMAVVMAALTAGGIALQISGVSSTAVLALVGLIMLVAACSGGLARRRLTFAGRSIRDGAEEPAR